MAGLHELVGEIQIPEEHQRWTDDIYASNILAKLCLPIPEVEKPDLAPEAQTIVRRGVLDHGEVVKGALVDATIFCLEWARQKGWQISNDFGLKLDWGNLDLHYLVARTAGAISETHMYARQNNRLAATDYINFSLSHIEDYCRAQGWSLEEAVVERINNRNNKSYS